MSNSQASVLITTKNRKNELRNALVSAVAQTAMPEILVLDDGSTDGTAEMVLNEFPAVRIIRTEQSQGYILQRNRGVQLASAPIVFSLDDDAIFTSADTISQVLAEFDHPHIGVVAIPFVDVNSSPIVKQVAPNSSHSYVAANFCGTAHALRRDLFLRLGGYREIFFHQGEEGDYSLRLLQAGYVVRLSSAAPIYHFESTNRDRRRMDLYGRRNNVLFGWFNVPLSNLIPHLVMTSINGLLHGVRVHQPFRMLYGLLLGYLAVLWQYAERSPVHPRTYKLYRHLISSGPIRLSEIESELCALS